MDPPDRGRGASPARFRRDPHPSLRASVVEYWAVARDLAAIGGLTITPDSFGELVCCADDLYAVDGDAREELRRCVLIGLLERPFRIEADGLVRCMAARLRPWSVGRLLATLPDRPGRGWKDASALFGARLDALLEMVARSDWESLRVDFDRVLIEQLAPSDPGEAGIELVAPFLEEGGGRPTSAVAAERETTRRRVERRVRRLTGTSPKRLAGLARFQKVRDAIWADPSIDLARLAYEAGFADQPHMTREFRRYAGQTPSRFARRALEEKNRAAAGDVAFVQERPAPDGYHSPVETDATRPERPGGDRP